MEPVAMQVALFAKYTGDQDIAPILPESLRIGLVASAEADGSFPFELKTDEALRLFLIQSGCDAYGICHILPTGSTIFGSSRLKMAVICRKLLPGYIRISPISQVGLLPKMSCTGMNGR